MDSNRKDRQMVDRHVEEVEVAPFWVVQTETSGAENRLEVMSPTR